jgi:hypothetical protein
MRIVKEEYMEDGKAHTPLSVTSIFTLAGELSDSHRFPVKGAVDK